MPEKWKAIPGYEGWYEVSDRGRVRALERTTRHGRKRKRHVLKAVPQGGSYLRVDLSRDNRQRTRLVHQLVLEAFVGPANGMQVRHLNGKRQDNRLENLCWGTISENALDRSKHGRGTPSGQASPRAILTRDEVRAIRAWPRYGRGLYAQYSHVSKAAVDAIRAGYNWKHLT